MSIKFHSFSECGPRANNEDYIATKVFPDYDKSIFVLCDGMGGHQCGELASRVVAENLTSYWSDLIKKDDTVEKINLACDETKAVFDNYNIEMGTTMAMLTICKNKAIAAHCGDSRIYIVRDGEIIYQSTDHNAYSFGWPVVTRSFFRGSDKYRPDIQEIELLPGDIVLLCSDGVYGNGKESALHKLLTESQAIPIDAIKAIAANKPHDNYSAILIQFH